MKYDPRSAVNLIADGEYDVEIVDAEDTVSKGKGNDMIKLTVRVWAGGGDPRVLFDYVVNPTSIWRLKQIAAMSGQQAKFDSGEMTSADLRGCTGRALIKTQKDKSGQFEDKNVIARYLPRESAAVANGAPAATHGADDTPF